MNNSDFEGPPLGWSLFSIVGGLMTATALIVGLELSADRLRAHIYGSVEATPASNTATKHTATKP